MAQKKKKGPPPRSKEPVKKKITVTQVLIGIVGIIMVLSMIISAARLGN